MDGQSPILMLNNLIHSDITTRHKLRKNGPIYITLGRQLTIAPYKTKLVFTYYDIMGFITCQF